MQTLKGLALLIVTIALSGCLATVGELAKSADTAFDKFSTSTKAMIAEHVKQDKADEYASFAAAEMALVRRLIANQHANGLDSLIHERTINIHSSANSQNNKSVGIVASFRLEIHSDAVATRHRLVLTAVESVTEYVAHRQQQEPSRLVIVGRNRADVIWMKEAAEKALAHSNKSLPIETEISPRNAAIGWMSNGSVDRFL